MSDRPGKVRVRACSVAELPPGGATQVPIEPPLAVYNVDGTFYATADTCSHERSSLAEDGYVDGDVVECGWHFAKFCIRTGQVLTLPATESIATFEVVVDDGVVFVLVDSAGLPEGEARSGEARSGEARSGEARSGGVRTT